jgi:F1F0 ATPase subunit 2
VNEFVTLSVAAIAGCGLGAVFFGGLWWSVNRGLQSGEPALWFFGSLVVRTVVAVAGFYYVGGGHWRRMLACLVGFVLARVLVMRVTAEIKEVSHAP